VARSHRSDLKKEESAVQRLMPRLTSLVLLLVVTALGVSAEPEKPQSASQPTAPGPYVLKHHQRINKEVKQQGKVDLILIGDSITHGWQKHGDLWGEFFGGRNAVNMGISGDRTQWVLWRLDHGNIDGIEPKLAMLMIGTNNSGRNKPEEIAEGITLIVKKLRTKLPKTKILLLAIFPRGDDPNNPNRRVNEKVNKLIARLDDGSMVQYLDIGSGFLGSNGGVRRDLMPDGLHPNAAGYRLWGEAVEPAMAKVLGSRPKQSKEKPQPKKAAAKCAVAVTTERPDAMYTIGQEVTFLVEVAVGRSHVAEGTASYTLDDEGDGRLGVGVVALGSNPGRIVGRMDKPGFLRCRVSYRHEGKGFHGLAAAAVAPEKITPSLLVPDDFDAFWQQQKERLARVAINPRLTPVVSPDAAVECFDVQADCVPPAPVCGYYARPKDAKPKSLPAMLWVHGAGVYSSRVSQAVLGAKRGMISMDLNAHGIPNGKPAEYYKSLGEGGLRGYPHRGSDNRQECYFLGMYLRLVRAIDFLCAQPEWDQKIVVVSGHSQGGGQSIVAGGLDSRVTAIAAGIAAMCDHTGPAVGRVGGWPRLLKKGRDGKFDPKVVEASRYFDAVNFASRCSADALLSVGFVDLTCQPTTVYAAYNQLKGAKQILNEPRMAHEILPRTEQAFLDWIDRHVAHHRLP
jgi:cephalosporin-C deacetylase